MPIFKMDAEATPKILILNFFLKTRLMNEDLIR